MIICTVQSCFSYPIIISSNLLENETILSHLPSQTSSCAIIADSNVASNYGGHLLQQLKNTGLKASLFPFPSGEKWKTRSTKELLEDKMFAQGFGRDTCIIALGGGITTDLAGYIAATYCRGIPFIMMPTSLLAMVDASIGGKVGVNTPFGKNLLGCFYQPQKVLINCEFLKSLPKKELKNGIVEMIKHGLIYNSVHFEFLETNIASLLSLDPKSVTKAVEDSCTIKKNIVEQDEREQGIRRLLNFGHTIGHALEKLTHFEMSHGEAVAIGLLVESYISMQQGYLSEHSFQRIQGILKNYELPLNIPEEINFQTFVQAMSLDKKASQGTPRFVMINDIGSSVTFNGTFCSAVSVESIHQAFQWMKDALCRH